VPPYAAVIVCVPSPNADAGTTSVAVPCETTTLFEKPPPSVNCTKPALTSTAVAVTVAVNVTSWLDGAGFGAAVSVVVVVAGSTK
jgi:hypothetical protein